jgi:membrane-associated phospholipid phosphatase
MRRLGGRGFEALIVNSLFTTVLKVGVGRARPDSGYDGDDFRPGSFSASNWSYPSGHTSTVFALATVVSDEFRDEAPWVPFVAYPLAGWTGISRVLDSRHWFTDVVAGAALGVLSGRLVSRRHETDIGSVDEAVQPELVVISEGAGIGLGVRIVH